MFHCQSLSGMNYRIMNLNLYQVDMITDLDEQVSVCVNAYDESEALTIGISMLENGDLECAGQICASASAIML